MDAWEYVINSMAWSAGGLLAGYLLGRADRRLANLEDEHHDDA